MRFMAQGCRILAAAVLIAACDGGGVTPPPVTPPLVATGLAAASATTQTAVAGTAVAEAPTVRVTDQNGQPLAGVAVAFAVAGGGSVQAASASTDASGLASAGSWTLGPAAGAQSVTATAGSLPPVQFGATAQARVPAAVVATSATAQTAVAGMPVAQPPAVRVTDQTGQPLAGATVAFTVTAGNGAVGSASVPTGADGTASAGLWNLGDAGTNTVTATVAALPPVAFTATAQARVATTVTAASTTAQAAFIRDPVAAPPAVLVKDQTGQPLAGVAVTFAVTGGGGTLTGASAVTNPAGVATVGSWTLGAAPGQNTLTATVAGLPPVQFGAEGMAMAPAALVAVSATSQTAPSGTAVPQPPTVRVNDADGFPVAGAEVTFAITSGFGSLERTSARTNAEGLASAGAWTLGEVGQHSVMATANLVRDPVVFTATATDPCASALEYALFSTVSGTLTTADCVLRFGEWGDFYAVRLPVAQAVVFTLASTVYDTRLWMYDGASNLMAFDDDPGPSAPGAALRVFAPSGTWFLAATSVSAGHVGPYTLGSAGIQGNAGCQRYWVIPGVVIDGQVQATDCDDQGTFSDRYDLILHTGETLVVRMESTALNAYLRLYNVNGTVVAENDNGAGGQNAVVSYTAQEVSRYTLQATTAVPGATGAYTLTVTHPSTTQARVRTGATRPAPAAASARRVPLPPRIVGQGRRGVGPARRQAPAARTPARAPNPPRP
jgi:hypothetical protein